MNLKLLIVCTALLTFSSCAFKSEDASGVGPSKTLTELKIDPLGDSDGDGIKDADEVARGSNPFVADLPDLKIRFLQNYKIEVFYHQKDADPIKGQKTFVINTDVKDTNPDFKFRVGNVFARNHALKTAASFGRFSSHTSGAFEEHDLSWVSYPELDPMFFHGEALKYRDIFNDQNIIDDIKITLSNQARLNESAYFKEIKNLKLNFYFLNHETENYEILSSVNVDRHLQSGVYESFDVVIDHAPVGLLKESFFKRGEFIISEVDDYEVPSLATNYKTLLASVKSKTVPVLYETPLEEKTYYVAAANGTSFQGILKAVFDKNYEVKEDALVKIGQFQNNLSDFTHLKEVQDKDKLGKWFVMTNEFKENYLDHRYLPKDRIVLSYITGSSLSEQMQENIYSYASKIDGNKSESILPLGNVTPNSKIEFTIHPINRFGRAINHHQEVLNRTGGSCGNNCISLPINCTWEVNEYKDYNELFAFAPDLSGEGDKLDLIINGEAHKLSDLLKEKKILVNKSDVGIHITINDISKIKEIKDFEENNLSLKVRSFAGSDFFGVKLTVVGGYWQGFGGCPFNTPAVAEAFKTQLSTETRDLIEIQGWANQAHQRGWPYTLTTVESGAYYQEISLGVSSSIQNYFN
jgi:hypothetical protein